VGPRPARALSLLRDLPGELPRRGVHPPDDHRPELGGEHVAGPGIAEATGAEDQN